MVPSVAASLGVLQHVDFHPGMTANSYSLEVRGTPLSVVQGEEVMRGQQCHGLLTSTLVPAHSIT
eukprot:CAMPEP_0194508330 /NCGR_PEP_ID=MMETSP0253-20130528/38467_1 /TAXON_ID=2966 /ORGANISM="Noctiluca scintillans" /LENGTH=64 /DNA_ID=CAMNT_0039351351 /DNA_START=572 /DNA_END=763 /DNA_ORIENTATION=-